MSQLDPDYQAEHSNSFVLLDGDRVAMLLRSGRIIMLNVDDYPLASRYRWYEFILPSGESYAVAQATDTDGGATWVYLDRLIMDAPEDMDVDHLDDDGLNNMRSNLRLVVAA